MTNTVYGTVEGLPPTPLHDADITNAYDLATLARALIHHTDLLQWSSMETAPFDYGAAMLHNTNRLIGHFEGADGIKTGFTLKAGFNLTATARRGNMRLVAVVLGAPSNGARFVQAAKLLGWGFDNFEKVEVVKQGQLLPMHVRVGVTEVDATRGTTHGYGDRAEEGRGRAQDGLRGAGGALWTAGLGADGRTGGRAQRQRSRGHLRRGMPVAGWPAALPIRQQPGVGDVPSASVAEIPAERGATIRVVTPPGQVAAPVPGWRPR